ncbi:MAG: hypothetical protein R2685_13840 [Candidatus Nitrosocosmicus sp.]|nr:hypothetical protein [Candidatus Nitrosocosmicus sp.]
MKKKSKIRVIKDDTSISDGYTFLSNDFPSIISSDTQGNPREIDAGTDTEKLDKVYKKKKVLTNEDMVKSSKGLKFNKPSQRNHSSVYE